MSHADPQPTVTIRYAVPGDERALATLAAVDSQPLPDGVLLVAEVDGRLWAAVSVAGSGSIADPFHPTADVRTLLEARAAQLRRASGTTSRRRRPVRGLRRVPAGG